MSLANKLLQNKFTTILSFVLQIKFNYQFVYCESLISIAFVLANSLTLDVVLNVQENIVMF